MTDIRIAKPLGVPATGELRFLPEGPYAIGDSRFSWVGIQHGPLARVGSLNLYDFQSDVNRSFDLPGRPGFAFPCSGDERFVVGCERAIGFYDPKSRQWTELCGGIDEDVDNTIINDAMVHGDNLIFGTKDLEFANQKAGLYLYRGRDGRLIRLRDDQICSNGKAIRRGPDGDLRLIDIDSPTRRVVSYPLDIDNATLGDPEILLDLRDDPAVPDGAILTPDRQQLIVSMFLPKAAEYGETRLYDLASRHLQTVWQTPGSPQNTCPALVRHENKVCLIITTALENMNAQDQAACPNAGLLFLGETDFDAESFQLPPTFDA